MSPPGGGDVAIDDGDNRKGWRPAMSYHLIDLVQSLEHPRLLVLGDLILDRYVWGDAERVSQEAPVILLREERQEVRLGGAANVAHMLRGLEAQVVMAGVVGADLDGRQTRQMMESLGVDCVTLFEDESRPTTVKERYIGKAQHRHPHQMLRVDREVRTPLSDLMEDRLIAGIREVMPGCQAVLISDYAKGVCTARVLRAVIDEARKLRLPVIADPPSSGNCEAYRGATAITPNRLETSRATGLSIESRDDAFEAGRRLCKQLDLEYAFVTLDSDGMAVIHRDGRAELFPTRIREVYDITGAGDMVLATIGVGAAAGLSPEDLARLANVAGGLEVEHVGVVTVSRDEIVADLLSAGRTSADKVNDLEMVARHVQARQALGQRVVFTNGCFDVLHVGHVSYLQQAAEEGDCLIVGLNSDSSVRGLGKGPDRPIFGQQHRAAMLAALEAVDYVVIFDESTPERCLERIRPDCLVKGGTYDIEGIVGREIVTAYGGEVKALGAIPGLSSTEIIRRIRAAEAAAVIAFPPATEDDHGTSRKKAG